MSGEHPSTTGKMTTASGEEVRPDIKFTSADYLDRLGSQAFCGEAGLSRREVAIHPPLHRPPENQSGAPPQQDRLFLPRKLQQRRIPRFRDQ